MRTTIQKNILDAIETKKLLIERNLDQIEKIAKLCVATIQSGKKLLFFGNGGSASDSQHLAAEFVGRYEKERRPIAAIALTTDTSILTAVGNDYGYDQVFVRQIIALGQKGDLAFAISTSGRSPSVVEAVRKAKELGIQTVGFLGKDGGDLKSLVDIPLVVPAQKTSRIQECHILVGHILCELVDDAILSK